MIVLMGGEEKTGKTTLALSFPKPMLYQELDLGGYDRAKTRFSKEELSKIDVRQYPIEVVPVGGFKTVASVKEVHGEKERWQKFIADFTEGCADKDIRTIVMDTWFQVYELVRQAYLQELQEAQLDKTGKLKSGEDKLRESLKQVEYSQPNAKLRNIIFYARSTGKNLVLVTYDADEYKVQIDTDGRKASLRTGRIIMGGWKETEKHCDISFWCSRNGAKVSAKIDLPGLAPLGAVGTECENNYSDIVQVLETFGVEIG